MLAVVALIALASVEWIAFFIVAACSVFALLFAVHSRPVRRAVDAEMHLRPRDWRAEVELCIYRGFHFVPPDVVRLSRSHVNRKLRLVVGCNHYVVGMLVSINVDNDAG